VGGGEVLPQPILGAGRVPAGGAGQAATGAAGGLDRPLVEVLGLPDGGGVGREQQGGRFLELADERGLLPGELRLLATEVTVRGRLP
jgi:hypothetical protein